MDKIGLEMIDRVQFESLDNREWDGRASEGPVEYCPGMLLFLLRSE